MATVEADLNDLADEFVRQPRHAVVSTFPVLAVRVILGLNSELYEIQRLLSQVPQCNAILRSAQELEDRSVAELPTLEDVRRKLETHYDFLLRFVRVDSLARPDRIDRAGFEKLLENFRRSHPSLAEKLGPWDDPDDLVGLFINRAPKRDRFTQFSMNILFVLARHRKFQKIVECLQRNLRKLLPNRCIQRIGKERDSDENDSSFTADEELFANIVVICNVFIASFLNVSSMFALYAIKSIWGRIATILAFSFLFTLSTMIFTTAESVMIYTSTAAYSAVLVVFIGNIN